MTRLAYIGLAAASISGLLALPAYAREPPPCDHPEIIKFAPGKSRARVSSDVLRGYSACYVLHARAGQMLSVNIVKDDEENIEDNVYAPGYRLEANSEGTLFPSSQSIGRVLYDADYDPPENDFSSVAKAHIDVSLKKTGNYIINAAVSRGSSGTFIIDFTVR